MKRVLVTGATGLIGKEAIKPLLDFGYEIYAISTKNTRDLKGVKFINADLFGDEDIKKVFKDVKPSHLLHFAWCASGDYLTSDDNYKFMEASMKMLDEFHENGGKRAVFAGTCFEYEFKDETLKETDKLNPQTVYAICKNELRERAQKYCEETGMSFGWGRIFYVYGHGENEKRLTPHIINSLKNNKEVVINNGDLIKDYMYAKDIAAAFVKFLDTNVCGCVNICTGAGISLKEYAGLIAQNLGKKEFLVIKNEPTTQPKIIVGDNSRLLNEVGYKIQYNIEDAINKLIRLEATGNE